MQVPTIQFDEPLSTGSSGPEASPKSFGPDLSKLDEGFSNLSRGLEHLGTVDKRIQKHKDTLDNTRWLSEATEQEKAHLSEYMANPANNQSESFSNDFQKYALDRIQQYEEDAPSPEAATAYRQHMMDFIGRRYESALNLTERTKISNSINSLLSATEDSLKSYNFGKSIPGVNASQDLMDSYGNLRDSVDTMFGVAPATASKLKEKLAIDFAYGTMNDNPDLAKKIVNEADMDERNRQTLLRHIDTAQMSMNLAAKDEFNRSRKDLLTRVQAGAKNQDKLGIDEYQKFYPAEHALIEKRADDEVIDAYGDANKILDQIGSWGGSSQISEISKQYDKIAKGTEHDKNVYNILATKVSDNLQMQKNNRVQWLQLNNPEVKSAFQRTQSAPPELREQMITELNDVTLKYQGSPAVGTNPDEAKKYLNLPEKDWHLMRQDESEQFAYDINKSGPAEVLKTINDVLSKYPDTKHQFTAFNDLVTMPAAGKGIRQEYQLAWQNKGAWWLDTYLGAVASEKPLVQLTEEKRKEFDQILDTNPTWRIFQTSMIGDNFQRAKEIDGFKAGITAYSHAMMINGKSPKEAINKSVDSLISSTLGFANVNSHPLVISRQRSNGTGRSNEEITDIGRKLSLSLKYVDPRQIDQSNFRGLQQLGDENRIERLQVLRDSITSRGFFQTSNDGQSAQLYYLDDNGSSFQIKDRQGVPFQIHFDALPEFTEMKVNTGLRDAFLGPDGMPIQTADSSSLEKTYASKTYPLASIKKHVMFGSNILQTNWPAAFPWEK